MVDNVFDAEYAGQLKLDSLGELAEGVELPLDDGELAGKDTGAE